MSTNQRLTVAEPYGKGPEQRDLGLLLYHTGDVRGAFDHLTSYLAWREEKGDKEMVPSTSNAFIAVAAESQVREDNAVDVLMVELQRRILEETLQSPEVGEEGEEEEGGAPKTGEV